jgi:hypothetical protein
MNPAALQRFEEAIRTHGDVEAALDELDQAQAVSLEATDVGQRIQDAALLALREANQA